jgi:hypothetical protein
MEIRDSLAPQICEILLRGGWQPDRTIHLEPFRRLFVEAGYPLFPKAEAFIGEFGELSIVYPHVAGKSDVLDFTIESAIEWSPFERLEPYSRWLGMQVCPLGVYHWDHFKLFISESGEIYGTFGAILDKLGRTPHEAVTSILLSHLIERTILPD